MWVLVFGFGVVSWFSFWLFSGGVFVQLRIKTNFKITIKNRCTLAPSVLEQNLLVLVQVFKGLVPLSDE